MVLAGNDYLTAVEILYRVVGAMMSVRHFFRLGTARQGQELVTQTDAKERYITLQELANCRDGIVTGFRVAGAI